MIRRWKQRLTEVRYGSNRLGKRREDPHAIYMAVRAFYADLSHWALEDPARWARWVAPNPIHSQDTRGMAKQRSRSQAKMHQRIRELAPLLPALVETAEAGRRHATQTLQAASAVAPGEQFERNGERFRRSVLATDPNKGGTGRPGIVYADNPDGGRRINLTLAEDNAFWTWAIVEVLRHTGVRIEELLELTHRGFVAYTLPSTGEVVPLLQIVPSKTDRERLLVVSPELAEVLTAVIARGRGENEQLPMVSRYDGTERLHSPPLPFLFQRPWGLSSHCFTHHYVRVLLDRLVTAAKLTATDGTPLRFTPHDFRRHLFITDAIMHGMPPHIAQLVAGHRDINTTMGYKAVYPEEVITGHRAFIARRRALRPSEEYRTPSDEEWSDFLGHFERRKVAVGDCGRSYSTPCIHEHSCLRCPLLRPDPDERPRLTAIRDNLLARITEAEANRWLGEAEGLKVSLAGARDKLAQMDQISARRNAAVDLGIPNFSEAAGRTLNTSSDGAERE